MKSTRARLPARNLRPGALAPLGVAAALLAAAAPARAHAFGARYDLPLPLEFYLAGAGAAVALSFAIMAFVFRARPARDGPAPIDLLGFAPARALLHPLSVAMVQGLSLALFCLVLAAGFLGNQDSAENFAPAFVWIIWWVGLAYVAALAGNPWPAINPWSIAYRCFERAARLFGARGRTDLGLPYPSWLGVWPAVALFALFAWIELISETAKIPATLATIILIYSLLTWLGMAAFGRQIWLAHGEAFSLAFAVLGRFAPLGAPVKDHWHLRPYAGALVVTEPRRLSMTVFVLAMLATVTFDGLKETELPHALLQWIAAAPALHALPRAIHDLGLDFRQVLESVLLVLFPALFVVVFLAFSWLARLASGSARPVTEIAGLFVFSLVPIAIAYHLAHYLSYLLIAGQLIIPLASDPFGFGWDMFGTADREVDIGVVGAEFIWYMAVAAIVAGHVFAVGVAHFVALEVFETARAALRSQYPFLVLMVAYTVMSLWILAQPIVGSPPLSLLRAPAATLSLAPFEFREYCLEMAPGERVRYRFSSRRPVDFDIHFHDGLTIRYPVKLSAIAAREDHFIAETDRSYCLMWFNRSLMETSLEYGLVGPAPK